MKPKYTEIRFHGRGGQGIVTASALLSQAFFFEGKYPRSLPLYGPQRRGAPVTVFLRVGDEEMGERSWIYNPQFIVVLDDSLIEIASVTDGMPEGGIVVLNTMRKAREDLDMAPTLRIAAVDADEIAYRLKLGGPPYPRINTLILAAFARMTDLVSLDSVIRAAVERFPSKDDRMETGMREAYEGAKWL